jgi:PAS domain S-box-containing protein
VLAVLVTALALACIDILEPSALLGSALPASVRWLGPAFDSILVLTVGAIATRMVSRLVLERKKYGQELALRAQILDAADDSIFVYHPSETMVYTNEAGYKSRGCTREELMKMNRRDLAAPEHGRFFDQWTKSLTEKEERLTEPVRVRKDGSPIPVEVRARHIKIDDQDLIISVCRDITGRKQAEERLRQSEKKYSTLVEQAHDSIVIIQDGRITFANSKVAELSGFAFDEIRGRPFIDFVSPAHRASVADRYKRRISGQEVPNTYETEILAKDGRSIPVEVSAGIIEYEGKPGDMAIIRDIADRKQGEEPLRAERENFRNSMEMSPFGIQIVTAQGDLVYSNPTMLGIWGYSGLEELKAVQDITERKQAEALYRTLADSSPTGVYIAQDREFVFANPAFKTATGYTQLGPATRDSLSPRW